MNPATQTKEILDIREKGAPKGGLPQMGEKRLYMQLQVFTDCAQPENVISLLNQSQIESVLYLDVNDPKGIGLLITTENPTLFTQEVRALLLSEPFSRLTQRSELTMLGRTYSTGRENDLDNWLLAKPRRNALNPKWPWAIWYPLRRKPEFELLPKEDQGKILYEHAKIGIAYGQAGLAHDIRLACYGLDQHDNEFVIGLVGADLYPLSRVVQDMRKTEQTAKYIESLGPFFVGKAVWQSSLQEKYHAS